MGLHEVAIGGIYISPLLFFALLALPITRGILILLRKMSFFQWVWHEMLFVCALYLLIFCMLTLLVGMFLM